MSITEFDHNLETCGLYPAVFICVIPVINTSDKFHFESACDLGFSKAGIKSFLLCKEDEFHHARKQVFAERNLLNAEDQTLEALTLSV